MDFKKLVPFPWPSLCAVASVVLNTFDLFHSLLSKIQRIFKFFFFRPHFICALCAWQTQAGFHWYGLSIDGGEQGREGLDLIDTWRAGQSWLLPRLPLWPWTCHFISPVLNFLICPFRLATPVPPSSQACWTIQRASEVLGTFKFSCALETCGHLTDSLNEVILQEILQITNFTFFLLPPSPSPSTLRQFRLFFSFLYLKKESGSS